MTRRPHVVYDLLYSFERQVRPAQQENGLNGPRREGTEGERRRQDEEFVQEGPLCDGPQHGQLSGGGKPDGLLCVDSEVVAQNACRLFAGHFRHDGHVVHQHGDVVKQGKESTGHEAKVQSTGCQVLFLT